MNMDDAKTRLLIPDECCDYKEIKVVQIPEEDVYESRTDFFDEDADDDQEDYDDDDYDYDDDDDDDD